MFTSKSKIRRTKNVNSFVYNPRMVKPTIYVGSDNEFCETLPVWPDGKIIYSIFGLLAQWKFGKNHLKFAKVGSNFWQIQTNSFKIARGSESAKVAKFCQIWSHWRTLLTFDTKIEMKCFSQMSVRSHAIKISPKHGCKGARSSSLASADFIKQRT